MVDKIQNMIKSRNKYQLISLPGNRWKFLLILLIRACTLVHRAITIRTGSADSIRLRKQSPQTADIGKRQVMTKTGFDFTRSIFRLLRLTAPFIASPFWNISWTLNAAVSPPLNMPSRCIGPFPIIYYYHGDCHRSHAAAYLCDKPPR